jgi:PhnB protein
MPQINSHINFNGNAEEAFTFYKSVFGGEFTKVVRFKEISSPEYPIPEAEENKLMHIALPIGDNVLMANDILEVMGRVSEEENRSKIAVNVIVKKKPSNYLMGYQKEVKLKSR